MGSRKKDSALTPREAGASDSRHTPGPWEVGELDHNGQRIVRGEHIEICTCWHHSVGSIEKEMEANARLIAAAPDLLEALHKLREPPTVTGDADTISAVMDLHELQCAVIDRVLAKVTRPPDTRGEARD